MTEPLPFELWPRQRELLTLALSSEPRPLSAEERAKRDDPVAVPGDDLLDRYEATVRAVEAERDRLAARVARLERGLNDIAINKTRSGQWASGRAERALADDGGPG